MSLGGFSRAPLAEDSCFGMVRTPVDYAMSPEGWKQDPHYKAQPSSRFQPLDYGPVDFHPDQRRLNKFGGELFQQYRNDFKGCCNLDTDLRNDLKNRQNVLDLGDISRKRRMDDAWNSRFGPNRGQPFTESVFENIDPTRQKIYGGNSWLHFDRLQSS